MEGGLTDSDGSLSDLEAGILSSGGSHPDSSSGGSISDSESEDKEMAAIMEVGARRDDFHPGWCVCG